MQGKIFQVIVPTEEEIELKDGQRRVVETTSVPRLRACPDDHGRAIVVCFCNTPNVTSFVGMGNKPTRLPDGSQTYSPPARVGRTKDQRLTSRSARRYASSKAHSPNSPAWYKELYPDKGRARVMVSFFNRETPVDVDFLQLEKV